MCVCRFKIEFTILEVTTPLGSWKLSYKYSPTMLSSLYPPNLALGESKRVANYQLLFYCRVIDKYPLINMNIVS